MTFFKLRYKVLGAHTHVRVFSSSSLDGAFALNGSLSFRNDEWKDFLSVLDDYWRLHEPYELQVVSEEEQ